MDPEADRTCEARCGGGDPDDARCEGTAVRVLDGAGGEGNGLLWNPPSPRTG